MTENPEQRGQPEPTSDAHTSCGDRSVPSRRDALRRAASGLTFFSILGLGGKAPAASPTVQCGANVVSATGGVAHDAFCGTWGRGGFEGFGADYDCGKVAELGGVHSDDDCGLDGQSGIGGAHSDDDCGKSSGGAIRPDSDCGKASNSGVAHPDQDCASNKPGGGHYDDSSCGKRASAVHVWDDRACDLVGEDVTGGCLAFDNACLFLDGADPSDPACNTPGEDQTWS